jgi:hypothetical protein
MKKLIFLSFLIIFPVLSHGQILTMTLSKKNLDTVYTVDRVNYNFFVETQFFTLEDGKNFSRDVLLFRASSGPMSDSIYRLPLACLGEDEHISSFIESIEFDGKWAIISSRIRNNPFKTFYVIQNSLIILDECHSITTPPK